MNIQKALESLQTTKGFSYNIETGELNPTFGYMVAVSKEDEVIISNVSRYKKAAIESAIKDYILSKADKLANKNSFLGAWIEDGKLYLDISERIASKAKAIQLCRQRSQLAYYDNAAGKAVNVLPEKKQAVKGSKTFTGALGANVGFSMNLNRKPKLFS